MSFSPNDKEYITFLFQIKVTLSESVRHIVCVMAVLSPTIEDDWSWVVSPALLQISAENSVKIAESAHKKLYIPELFAF